MSHEFDNARKNLQHYSEVVSPGLESIRNESIGSTAVANARIQAERLENEKTVEEANMQLIQSFLGSLPKSSFRETKKTIYPQTVGVYEFPLQDPYEVNALQSSIMWTGDHPSYVIGRKTVKSGKKNQLLVAGATSRHNGFTNVASVNIKPEVYERARQEAAKTLLRSGDDTAELFDESRNAFIVGPKSPGNVSVVLGDFFSIEDPKPIASFSNQDLKDFDVLSHLASLATLFNQEAVLDQALEKRSEIPEKFSPTEFTE